MLGFPSVQITFEVSICDLTNWYLKYLWESLLLLSQIKGKSKLREEYKDILDVVNLINNVGMFVELIRHRKAL